MTTGIAQTGIIDALRAHGCDVNETGDRAQAQCPAHEDRNPSLSIGPRRDGKGVVVWCHAGCDYVAILDAIALHPRDLFDDVKMREIYSPRRDYTFAGGRVAHRDAGKRFWQSGNKDDPNLYQAELVGNAETVYVCEGEKDAEVVAAVGGAAVSAPMGAAQKHLERYDWSVLRDKHVRVVPDKDDAGYPYAARVAEQLDGIAASVVLVEAARGKDPADHVANDLTLDEFVPVLQKPDAVPAPTPPTAVTLTHSGQVRMAYRLAMTHAQKLLYVHGIGWHWWDGRRWAFDDTGRADLAVLAVLRQALAESLHDKELRRDVQRCESAAGIAGVLAIASALPEFAASVRDLDADPYLFNHAGGTLDLRTLESRLHSPADRLTKVSRGAYRPEAESATWTAFLARVLPDAEVREFMRRYAGLGLLGAVREHVIVIGTGTGANGKSVLDCALRNALGDYSIAAEPDLFMHREGAHPTGEMDLRGVRWVAVSENDKDRRLAEATLKRLTGGDTIRARRMRQDFVEFTPSHTPFLITNHLPKVPGDDAAIWRRLRVVPFDVVIPEAERDSQLGGRLELEADAIIAWAVAGYRDYAERCGLDEPAGVRIATDDYQKASDAVRRFIDDECTAGNALKATTAVLHTAWEKWRVGDGADPMSAKAFGQALDRHGYPVTSRTTAGRWRDGIALKPKVDDGP